MYLDTDIVLALIKKKDWLKQTIKIEKIKKPKTSALVIIEAELILSREYGREYVFSVLGKTKKIIPGIRILPLEEKIIEKSIELMKNYQNLNIFDSMHAAFSILKNETIISTDDVFRKIKEVKCIDPREL